MPQFAKLLTHLLDGEEPPGAEVRFGVPGDVRTLHLVGRPVVATDGLVWSVHLIARDLTAQVRSRQRLAATRRQSERLREEAAAERRVASLLWEAPLPTRPAELAGIGLSVAAAYVPAESEAAVGGDWHKCRLLPDGRGLLAIGDACGHGLGAVALRPCDLLLLYADGMAERRGEDITSGIANLCTVLKECTGLTAREALDRIMAAYTPETHEDDTCLLAVRLD
ncbi:SpoIIE family protein phosphatase [Streptomyces xanthophaeus]|uniref:PPM-type phosphatase domain-containing protein n=1 Tax=Streptomyces xanthophaeus TaxID=67385 RepID=A0A919LBC3_9ACTN|nr:SpoIIE family protein phosphatase [Streptomyces xanthophaeus]GHI83316.1 hypothetical protein Sxan_06800 [Streptomyces xanthophaeus]